MLHAIQHCRVCGRPFLPEPLLWYRNMPKAAQHFPDEDTLSSDHGSDLNVYQCSGCGLVQLGEPPVPYFKDVIRAAAISNPVRELKREQFSRLIEKYGLIHKKIIEIGCGNGEFLELWNDFDVHADGLEHDETAVAHCIGKGLEVTQGYIDRENYRLSGAPYDAFALLMFLEHMPDPNASLRGILNNLAEGAIGLIEVPNFDMVVRKLLFSEFIADHLTYFTYDTLAFTLKLNGFEILERAELRDDYVLSVVVRKNQAIDLTAFHAAQTKVVQELRDFIDCFSPESIAVWGAGHQALAMISLAGIANKIKYVVDSAPFKQNRFTPATHVPVVSPSMLRTSPVPAVIVMAASYSDEVAQIFRKTYSATIPLAILRETRLEIRD
jgi:SAM-dependent methyltransferase